MVKRITKQFAAANLRACCLILTFGTTALFSTAHAAECPGLSDANVTITGTVVELLKAAGMLKIETKNCGKITVGIPAKTKDELELYYKECTVDSEALIEGETILGILEAREINCL